jgi:16S rRNA A1518/A1519 N6-dimethyltransferase RsmA/KsgA/DIM1 with predicted DNA glycosylase/AP lyase activity
VPFSVLPWPSRHEPFLFHLVQSAFAHRRKTLRANLLAMPSLQLTRPQLLEIFTALHLTEHTRAQELHVSQFVQLAAVLQTFIPASHAPGRG